MRKNLSIDLPKGKEAKNVSCKVIDGKLEVSYDLEDKFEPKDGDFVVTFNGNIYIYNTNYKIHRTYFSLFGFYAGIDGCNNIVISDGKTGFSSMKRIATKGEKQSFLERLEKECGKTWNAEKKCLEDIYKPKFGDIVKVTFNDINCFKRNYMICIYPDKPNIPDDDFFDIALIDMSGDYSGEEKGSNHDSIITKASIEAEKELFDKLAEAGKRWNPDTKQLENIRWEPKKGDTYYFVDFDCSIGKTEFCNSYEIDRRRVKGNNCFKTEEATQKVANQIKEIFKNSKAE